MPDGIIESLKESYNRYAHIREKSEVQEWKVRPRELFLELMKSEAKAALLDLGAGPGRDGSFFREHGIDVTAVDLSGEMVNLCREKGIEAYELDFRNLQQLNKSFDAVWAMNSLLHVEKSSLPSVLEEIKKVLKPSGLFFMGVYGGENSEGIWENDIYTPHRFFSFFTDEAIKAVVSRCFELISFERIDTGGEYHFQSIVMRNA
jgi:SAM-dependent methyltransferase